MRPPNGCSHVTICAARLASPHGMFDTSQMTAPAGSAKTTARQSTYSVRSMSEVYSVASTRGGRYGGSSRLKAETSPRSTVRESSHEMAKVSTMPSTATVTTASAETSPARCAGATLPTKIVATRICVGQRPLQSAKLFVMMAMSRSRGLSMMRAATTPAALQPQPMAIVSACLPCAPTRRNVRSRLKATRGR